MNILEKISYWSRKTPDSCAVIDNGTYVSYAELWERAEQLAADFKLLGYGKEDLLGLTIPKSADYIVAILGTWIAGAAFAPLPSHHPQRRIERACEIAGITEFIGEIPQSCGTLPPVINTQPKDLAYVVFTSGSSGEPKAVAVEHKGLCSVIDAQITAFNLGPGKSSLFYLDIGFDASLSDILTALCSGAKLVIEPQLNDVRSVVSALHRREITTFDCPPSLLPLFNIQDIPDSLETVVVGGEPSSPSLLTEWACQLRVVNVYGPTESTICSSLNIIDPSNWNKPIIGQPIKDTQYSIRDEFGLITTDSGELWTSGLGVARGYVGNNQLNQLRFVTEGEQRWYKTGDHVRQEGEEFVFLGRLDRQIKINGQLVAPEEIEARLLQHENISDAAVLKAGDALVAHVVGTDENLQRHLELSLPRWMRPTEMYWRDALPRLPNGKVDFRHLSTIKRKAGSIPPEGAARVLADLFAQALGLNSVGLDDDFFELGGDSLSTLQLISAADAKGFDISIESVVSSPTVRKLLEATPQPHGRKASEFHHDCLWAPSGRASFKASNVENIFLTGATGFLGTRLLYELLQQTDATVHCLVRGTSISQAISRLQQCLLNYQLEVDLTRVEIVLGDIDSENFGTNMTRYNELSETIDLVVHSAAAVNLLASYEKLKMTNVEGTRQVLEFSAHLKAKKLWYVSTLSVFASASSCPNICLESAELDQETTLYGGYAQSKWVAENLVSNAQNSLAELSIFRLGLLTGDQSNGIIGTNDMLSMFVRGVAELGCTPHGIDDLEVDITPVDYAATALVTAGLNSPAVVHIANPTASTAASLIDAIRHRVPNLKTVSKPEWNSRLATAAEKTTGAAANLALCRAFSPSFDRRRAFDLFASTNIKFDQAMLKDSLGKSRLACPVVTPQLWSLYLDNIFEPSEPLRKAS